MPPWGCIYEFTVCCKNLAGVYEFHTGLNLASLKVLCHNTVVILVWMDYLQKWMTNLTVAKTSYSEEERKGPESLSSSVPHIRVSVIAKWRRT